MTDEEFLKRMKAARARFREAKMKAHFHVNAKMRQELEAYAHEAVLKERADIGNRAVYLVLLAMDQAGLDRDTMCRVRDCVPVVTEKYAEYRNEQLADLWAKLTLDRMGVEVPGTDEPL